MQDQVLKAMKEIEVMGTVNEQGQLSLDQPLTITKNTRVRVIVVLTENEEVQDDCSCYKSFAKASW